MPASALRLAVASVLAAALAAGCGSDSPKESTDKAPTKAEAEAAAKAINLVAADLAGYESEPADTDDDSDTSDDDLEKCIGVDTPDPVVDVSSDDFSKGEPPTGVQVSSEVSVVASAADAKAELAAFRSDKAVTCLEQLFDKEVRGEIGSTPGVTVAPMKVTKGSGIATGTDGAFAFSVTSTISAQGISIPLTIDFDGFLVKRTEVSFITFGIGQSMPATERKALVDKLVERAKKSAV